MTFAASWKASTAARFLATKAVCCFTACGGPASHRDELDLTAQGHFLVQQGVAGSPVFEALTRKT
jgi:hypothetical protein